MTRTYALPILAALTLGAAACAYGIPMSIKRAHGYGSTRLQAELFGPEGRETASNVHRGYIFALQFLSHSCKQWVDADKELF